jgi:hypothetical protein
MVPPVPSGASKWFVPYLYTPSGNAAYMKLVTPWGTMDVTSMLKDELVNIVIALVVVAFSVGAWRAYASKGGDSVKKEATKEGGKSAKAASALEENIQTKGANSYYYAHQRRVVDDSGGDKNSLQKTKVSTYSWTDEKKTVTYV